MFAWEIDMNIAPGSDANKFLRKFIRAVQSTLPDKYTGTATIELHFHQGGLSRAASSFKSEVDVKSPES